MPRAAIVADKLTKWFGKGDARTDAVKEVSFQANWGEMLYIVGPSGSGKTTLLSMISGILRPNSGSVKIDNRDLWSLSDDELADFRLNTIGFVFQDYHLFPRLTTAENVAIPLVLKKRKWDDTTKSSSNQYHRRADLDLRPCNRSQNSIPRNTIENTDGSGCRFEITYCASADRSTDAQNPTRPARANRNVTTASETLNPISTIGIARKSKNL